MKKVKKKTLFRFSLSSLSPFLHSHLNIKPRFFVSKNDLSLSLSFPLFSHFLPKRVARAKQRACACC